jgi:myo-inositol-hexaphosphate 3-phosphohydrolase
LYYLDDVIVDIADPVVPVVDAVAKLPQVECTFGPNPASNQIRLQANLDQATVRIMGLDGKVVLQEVRNDLMNGADLSFDLRNGVYLVEISNGTSRSTQRLVVQK